MLHIEVDRIGGLNDSYARYMQHSLYWYKQTIPTNNLGSTITFSLKFKIKIGEEKFSRATEIDGMVNSVHERKSCLLLNSKPVDN